MIKILIIKYSAKDVLSVKCRASKLLALLVDYTAAAIFDRAYTYE